MALSHTQVHQLKAKLEADADTNQTALIYYSGHGHREASGESFLIPYDARFPVRLGGLAAKDFAESIDNIRPRRLLVVLDCCHAEGMEVKESDDFPQGDKTLRKEDHQAFLREFIFTIQNNKHKLLETVPKEKTIVPPACTFS